jgi:nitrogen fixation NifU-like protein
MSDMDDDLYREQILDHYKSPRNHGTLEGASVTAEGHNPLCGDQIVVDLKLADERIEGIRFRGQGCAISQASLSMLSERIVGMPIAEVAAIPRQDVEQMLGIPLSPIRLKCALLGLGVIKVALHREAGTPLPAEWAGMDEVDWH